ncbi:sn-glycerol-3-phosphate ABC transporter ATP-binding protein UgpC [Mesorhizobium sp. M7A.F.Ca.US.002.01.1.1]|uniref:ABC transporter ATP-binding protein n=1 Tax=Mesorhizobium sp. M7A.F.Ca.US.002.01.1.1 TaxID=2496700 RepID=UPI000FD43E85|nr:sn-glycerol-3-phosphate ABC transporter ATP-binding protein UgpC [Mesorhizobium sp. M7A.F.Ca.US.002.01.1.1]RVA15480.1 sn-glycerol-3-phosphate ABC transporter ATP-binding protein UgpC [Mesorhizobium sp. M7A.F.Ca.US.002.01.1.1]
MADVTLRQVKKSYGNLNILHGIDLDIRSGEFIVFVGPSGCGKSTLLRSIAGLEEITSGELRIAGEVVNDVPPSKRGIAMVFQSYALYPHMTVYDNMAFSMKIGKENKAEIDRRVRQAAEILQLTKYLDRLPKAMSGGQRQRVAIGRAIVRNPKVFLFDEPLSNLDAALRVATRIEIAKLKESMPNTTMIYVTHDQVEAMTLADRIVVLKDGHIEQVGTPMDLYKKPGNLFVAQFIGSPAMNILDGRTTTDGFVASDGTVFPLPALGQGESALAWGIRPEHLKLSDSGVPAVVEVVEPTGAETLVMAKAGNNTLSALLRERISVMPGQKVFLAPDLTQLHLFNAKGQRIMRVRNASRVIRQMK